MAIIRKLFKDDFAENIDFLREQFEVDQFKSEVMIITPRRWGKCLGGEEMILMADGSTRRAADIRVGDLLVGDDGRSRLVMNTCQGRAPMYKIDEASQVPSEDSAFTCNDAHLLVFEMRGKVARLRRRKRTLEVVERYFDGLQVRERTVTYSQTKEAKALAHVKRINDRQERPSVTVRAQELFELLQKQDDGTNKTKFNIPPHLASFRRQVDEFPDEVDVESLINDINIDADSLAYYVGVWLGDGTAVRSHENTVDVNGSAEIVEFLEETATKLGLYARRRVDTRRENVISMYLSTTNPLDDEPNRRCHQNWTHENPLQIAMLRWNIDSTKRIPSMLLGASREVRLALLAGLVDSDGHLETITHRYEIVQKRQGLANDIARLARSLGLAATIHERTINDTPYWRVRISGSIDIVPARLFRKRATPSCKSTHDFSHYTTSIESLGEGDYYGFQCASFAETVDDECRHAIAKVVSCWVDDDDPEIIDAVAAPFIAAGYLLPSLANGARAADGSFPGRFLLANHTVVHNTYSVAMFVAASAFAIESTTQAIFSTGRRASKKLLDLIYQFLCKLPGMKESIITKNVEEIRIQGPGGEGDIRTICSYPSKVIVSFFCSFV